ncbi:MAG TPA: hypothetical protein VIV63_14385 [Steroidobacteraceae bacterium]
MKLSSAALALILLGIPVLGACQTSGTRARETPPTPASIKGILVAQRFTLSTPYVNTWSKARAQVSSGTIVVLEVDPAYLVPTDAAQPVLYAGDVAVQRLNQGHQSGRVIGIVPGNVDLTTAPIWFGTPGLPERVTPESARAERALAEKAGIRPLAAARVAAVTRTPVSADNLLTVLRTTIANLVLQYSPQEKHLADKWRVPEARQRSQR